MRNLFFRVLYLLIRSLRPRGKRRLQSLRAGNTVLYAQFEKPLGCCIHGTPLIDALRASAPDVRVVVASRGPGAATVRNHPGVDHLIETNGDPLASGLSLWSTANELRGKLQALNLRPDVVIQDASSRRGTWALFAALLRLAPTVGFAGAPQLYDRYLPYDSGRSLIDNNLRLLEALGGAEGHREPAVFFTGTELGQARELLRSLRPHRAGTIGFVLQGSGGQRTGWHDQRFAEVIRGLEREGFETVFLGTAGDAVGIERVRSAAGSAGLSLAGKTSITQAAAVLCLCDLLITVDTGTMHLGRAVGVPMVVLGPSWQRPLEWMPLGLEQVRILRGPDRTEVPPDYRLDEIEVSDVQNAARELLVRYPPSAAARGARLQASLAPSTI